MGNKRFRFGLSVGGIRSRDELAAAVRKAEDEGFSVIVAPDHIGSRLAVLPMLMAVAELSSTMRISPMVIANDYRHPVILAKDAATIDILSNGRFELAIGTGWIKEQYVAAGIPYDSGRVRVDRLEEAIAVIRGCWSGGPFTLAGDHYHVSEITCPRPIQRPHPPLMIAGGGPRMLQLAGSEADSVSISPVTPAATGFDAFGVDMATSEQRIDAQLGWIRQGAGPRFDQIELSVPVNHLAVTSDPDAALSDLAARTGVAPSQVGSSPHVLVGTTEEITATLIERRERYGISYVTLAAQHLEALQPVVSRLAGT